MALKSVTQVEYLEDYKIKVLFSNGEWRLVDLADTARHWLNTKGKTTAPLWNLADPEVFRCVKTDGNTIYWEHPKAVFEYKVQGVAKSDYLNHDPLTLFGLSEPLPAKYHAQPQTA